jgi:hypothetical protein
VIVTVAVAFLLESKVTESELSAQTGEPACEGRTLQVSDTGLSNEFSKLMLSIAVVLWPGVKLRCIGADADIEKSIPVFSNTLIEFEV